MLAPVRGTLGAAIGRSEVFLAGPKKPCKGTRAVLVERWPSRLGGRWHAGRQIPRRFSTTAWRRSIPARDHISLGSQCCDSLLGGHRW